MTTAVKLSELINGNSGQIVVPSGGINFGTATDGTGTVSTNGGILDDYEEGSWTPTWVVATGSITAYSPHTSGFYRKIGDVVYIWGYIGYSSKSGVSNSDILQVGGLPFQSISSGFGQFSNQAGGVHMFAETLWSSNSPQGGRIPNNSSTISLTHSRGSQSFTHVTVASLDTGANHSQAVFYGQYLT